MRQENESEEQRNIRQERHRKSMRRTRMRRNSERLSIGTSNHSRSSRRSESVSDSGAAQGDIIEHRLRPSARLKIALSDNVTDFFLLIIARKFADYVRKSISNKRSLEEI